MNNPVFTVALTLQVGAPELLWDQAAHKATTAHDMTIDDVIDTIGPRDDAQIEDCLMLLLQPVIPGCTLRSFSCEPENNPVKRMARQHGNTAHAPLRVAEVRHHAQPIRIQSAFPLSIGPDFN